MLKKHVNVKKLHFFVAWGNFPTWFCKKVLTFMHL